MKQMIFNNQDRLMGIAAKALVLLGGALVALSLALAMSGCTDSFRENDYPRPWGYSEGDDDLVPVEFTVSSQRNHDFTRAESSIVSFNSGETVKVFVSDNGGSSYTDYDYTTAAAGQTVGLTAPAPPAYFPDAQPSTVQAYAYYPATAGASATFSVADNQTSDAAYKSSDLMYAANRTITKGSSEGTSLQMAHKMVQLCITASAASGSDLSIYKVKVNAKKSVTFTPADGTATATGDNGDVIALTQAGTGYVLIPPQLINNVTIKIETDATGTPSSTATFEFTSDNYFEAGYSYSMNLTVDADLIGITTTTAITDWDINPIVNLVDNGSDNLAPPVPTGAVDLGLSVYWATKNVGASSETDYGDLYAWGETTTKSDYSWDTYAHGTSSNQTKYNSSDGKTTLEMTDDVARQVQSGSWRMPTKDDWQELKDNCTWTWQSNYNSSGVAGYLVTSNKSGYTDKSIFLPAAGVRSGNNLFSQGSHGFYWSSSLYSDYPYCAWYLFFNSDDVDDVDGNDRYYGYSVRAVQDKP